MHRTGWEAQGLEARKAQNPISALVAAGLFQLSMVMAIHFHDQPAGETDEVEDVVEERRLLPEVKAVGSQCPEPSYPQANFLGCHGLSQGSSIFQAKWFRFA